MSLDSLPDDLLETIAGKLVGRDGLPSTGLCDILALASASTALRSSVLSRPLLAIKFDDVVARGGEARLREFVERHPESVHEVQLTVRAPADLQRCLSVVPLPRRLVLHVACAQPTAGLLIGKLLCDLAAPAEWVAGLRELTFSAPLQLDRDTYQGLLQILRLLPSRAPQLEVLGTSRVKPPVPRLALDTPGTLALPPLKKLDVALDGSAWSLALVAALPPSLEELALSGIDERTVQHMPALPCLRRLRTSGMLDMAAANELLRKTPRLEVLEPPAPVLGMSPQTGALCVDDLGALQLPPSLRSLTIQADRFALHDASPIFACRMTDVSLIINSDFLLQLPPLLPALDVQFFNLQLVRAGVVIFPDLRPWKSLLDLSIWQCSPQRAIVQLEYPPPCRLRVHF